MPIMIRTQVQLKEQQLRRLRALAAERGLSISELVRNGVDHILSHAERRKHGDQAQRAVSATRRFHSGRTDVARRHDAYLAATYKTPEE